MQVSPRFVLAVVNGPSACLFLFALEFFNRHVHGSRGAEQPVVSRQRTMCRLQITYCRSQAKQVPMLAKSEHHYAYLENRESSFPSAAALRRIREKAKCAEADTSLSRISPCSANQTLAPRLASEHCVSASPFSQVACKGRSKE